MLNIILVALYSFSTHAAQDLQSLYRAALTNTSAVKNKVIDEQVANEEKAQAYSEVLPSVSLNSDTTWRDTTTNSNFDDQNHTGYASLNQPLFQGGAEYYALRIARRLPDIAKQNRRLSEIQLYTRVANAFYTVFRIGRERQTLIGQEKTLSQRVRTLQKRAKIGRNKKTDVLAARSRLARVRADMALIDSDLLDAKLQLQNLTGVQDVEDLTDLTNIADLNIPESWDQSFQNNPQVLRLQLALKTAEQESSAATMAFMPSVDLGANYYFEREGTLGDSDWDVTLSATWELMSGGTDYRERRIQKLEVEKVKTELKDLERNLKNRYQVAKKNFLVKKSSVDKLKAATDIARMNYKQHVKEANQGLVSQLDVLRALEESLEVQRAYERQLYETKITYVELKELAGVDP